ncbi:MAG: TVP38/TMEM64 family protein [Phycisphaeraceae bacterium]|nr:MAG: TVP38/TMEM64 family protein [Phycisphaeraceae bacterium]
MPASRKSRTINRDRQSECTRVAAGGETRARGCVRPSPGPGTLRDLTEKPPEIDPAINEPEPDSEASKQETIGSRFILIARRLGPAGPLAVLAGTLPAISGILLLTTLWLVGPWLRELGMPGVALYIVGFAVLAGLALLPTYAQAILGGWAFGFALGFPAALAGFFGGSFIGYFVAHRVASRHVMATIGQQLKWQAVRDALVGGGFWKTLGIVTLLRLPPNSPFALMNLTLGSTRVPLAPYLLGTLIGMAPRTGAAVFIASGIADLAEAGKTRPGWFFYVGAGLTVVIVIVIGKIANKAIARVASGGEEASPEAGPDSASGAGSASDSEG